MKALMIPTLFAALVLALPAATTGHDIVDTAANTKQLSTLVTAVKKAGLVGALKSDGPFTVFAPTNSAFSHLPKGALKNLLRSRNRAQLQAVLKFHVVPGRLLAADVLRMGTLTTLNGQRLEVSASNKGAFVNGQRISATDIECSNGIVHLIDGVLLPESGNIVKVAKEAGSFGTLLKAAQAAGLAKALMGDGPFTVLAPTDEAFAQIPQKTLGELLQPRNRNRLAAILKYHVIPARVFSDQALAARQGETLQGESVRIGLSNGRLRINEANVVLNDIPASNGVIHVIDRVLMPSRLPKAGPQGRKMIGVYTDHISQALGAQLGLKRGRALLVTRVVKGSNAESAGLRRYDVISHISGQPASDKALSRAKEEAGYGGQIELVVYRRGERQVIPVTVGAEGD